MVVAFRRDEICFILVFQSQGNLVIFLEGIQKAHPQMVVSGIHQLVYLWDGKRVLRAHSIKVSKVNTNPPFPIFLHHHSISQPIRKEHFFDSPSLLQLLHFFFHGFHVVLGGSSRLLILWWKQGIHVQSVHYKLQIDAGHFVWAPCKKSKIWTSDNNIFTRSSVGRLFPIQKYLPHKAKYKPQLTPRHCQPHQNPRGTMIAIMSLTLFAPFV